MFRRASNGSASGSGSRGRWGTKGTAAVEFALVLPMLLAMLVGTVEVGFLILSHASMTATLARVSDEVQRATNEADVNTRLATLAEMQLGLGLAEAVFDPVVVDCVCPADAIRYLAGDVEPLRDCSVSCGAGVDPLRFYSVRLEIGVPSLLPRADIGVRRTSAQVTVMGP